MTYALMTENKTQNQIDLFDRALEGPPVRAATSPMRTSARPAGPSDGTAALMAAFGLPQKT